MTDDHSCSCGRDGDGFIPTAFSSDYTRNDSISVDGDRSWSFGAFAVQSWTRYGVSFYAGVRRYDVDRSDVRTEPITVFPIGGVFSF